MNRNIILLAIIILPLFCSLLWIQNIERRASDAFDKYSKSVNELHEAVMAIRKNYGKTDNQGLNKDVITIDSMEEDRTEEDAQNIVDRILNEESTVEDKSLFVDEESLSGFAQETDTVPDTAIIVKKGTGNNTKSSKSFGVLRDGNGKCGFVDTRGRTILDYEFDYIEVVVFEGKFAYLIVQKGTKFGAFSMSGIKKVPIRYGSPGAVKKYIVEEILYWQ
jgi:hypothetical protein